MKMEGTPKQIAWAEDLRDYAMQGLDALLRQSIDKCDKIVDDGGGSREDADKMIARATAQLREIREAANAHTDASWWIDNLAEHSPLEKGQAVNVPSYGERLVRAIKHDR